MSGASGKKHSFQHAAKDDARGRYDRTATASERARAQHTALLRAVRSVCAQGEAVTVVRLLQEVGCGRSTFYEHFDDASKAVDAACEQSAQLLADALDHVLNAKLPRTPGDAVNALAEAFVGWVHSERGHHWALLDRMDSRRMEEVLLGAILALHRYLVSVGFTGDEMNSARAHAATGALRAIVRYVAAQRPTPTVSLAGACQDALVRLLR